MNFFISFFLIFFIGCTFNNLSKNDVSESDVSIVENIDENSETIEELQDSLEVYTSVRRSQLDSLYNLIDQQFFTIDSLSVALEIANSRVAVNQNFIIPDSIIFAGRIFHFNNERIYEKFETIFKQELKAAHKFIPRSGKYFTLFDSIFTDYNVPLDSKYLAIAESRLSPMATSRVGAAGAWQFMPKTGKGFGLKIDEFVDERRHMIKATDAAAQYLKNSYSYLKKRGIDDWLLAMSAYNAGVGSVYRVAKKQGGDDFFELIMRVDETNQYVWRAVAIKMIFENEEEIFGKIFDRQPELLDEVRREKLILKGYYKIDEWAKLQGTAIGKIWEYNPWIKIHQRKRTKYSPVNDVVLSPGTYDVLVPKCAVKDIIALSHLEKEFLNKNGGFFTHHVVKKGDTLYKIAKKYKTSVTKIKSLNNLSSSIIYPGQKLALYGNVANKSYLVKKGDSVSRIAKRLGVSSNHIITKNNLQMKNGIVMIYPGQKLYY